MMLRLPRDVVLDAGDLRRTHCKRAVSVLPSEIFRLREEAVHPPGSIRFEIAQHVRQGLVGSQLHQEVNVVCRAVYTERDAALPANYAPDVIIKSRPIYLCDER